MINTSDLANFPGRCNGAPLLCLSNFYPSSCKCKHRVSPLLAQLPIKQGNTHARQYLLRAPARVMEPLRSQGAGVLSISFILCCERRCRCHQAVWGAGQCGRVQTQWARSSVGCQTWSSEHLCPLSVKMVTWHHPQRTALQTNKSSLE